MRENKGEMVPIDLAELIEEYFISILTRVFLFPVH